MPHSIAPLQPHLTLQLGIGNTMLLPPRSSRTHHDQLGPSPCEDAGPVLEALTANCAAHRSSPAEIVRVSNGCAGVGHVPYAAGCTPFTEQPDGAYTTADTVTLGEALSLLHPTTLTAAKPWLSSDWNKRPHLTSHA